MIDLKNSRPTLHSLADLLNSGKMSSVELCELYLKRAEEVEEQIEGFLHLDKEAILTAAKASDERRAAGNTLSLYDGVPVACKDNITVKDERCSCASKLLENFISPYDATVVERMKENGIILFGRTNMDEFAMGASCENSAFKITKNPWDTTCVPGGSSGGSAAVVAAGEVPASLGSDTGGSIRQPAGFCGVVGLKPTYGRISRYGLVAFASSLDQIGPITNDVEDAAILLDILSGHDPKDSTSIPESNQNFIEAVQNRDALKGLRIGLPKEYFEMDGLDAGVKAVLTESIETLKAAGAEIIDISLPHTEYAVASYYVIATAEASANLARFDGIRYGNRSDDAQDLIGTYFKSRGEGFGEEVKRRIILGTYVLSSGYYDAYYLRAQKVRTLIRQDFDKAFEKCDVIYTPVSPMTAFGIGEKSDPLQMYLADIFTIALNLAGNCGISLPAGLHKENGMPVGVQFIAPAYQEKIMLKAAASFEAARHQQEFIPQL